MTVEEAVRICNDFALRHDVFFEQHGGIGFGRECVGFLRRSHYVAYNPYSDEYPMEDETPFGVDDRFYCHDEAPNAYHKGDYLAVLVCDGDYDAAKIELAKWIQKIEEQGDVEIVPYRQDSHTLGAGLGYAIRYKGEAS